MNKGVGGPKSEVFTIKDKMVSTTFDLTTTSNSSTIKAIHSEHQSTIFASTR